MHLSLLVAQVSLAAALCPMHDLVRRDAVPEDIKARYLAGQGLGEPLEKRQNDPPLLDPVSEVLSPLGAGSFIPREKRQNDPPLLDPLSEILSPLDLGSLVPRSARSNAHNQVIDDHIRSRLEERDEDVDIDAPILTPKAHRRYHEKRGLLGGLLAPLTGVLSALDVPTPQESGLKKIPGNDPDHQYQPPGPTDVRGNCPTLNTLANHGYLSRTGITTFADAANAIQTAYSISFDLAVLLSALGLLAGGDIITGKYSIGGRDSRVPETLGVPLYGIDRHGLFEIDASVSRGDRYFGDNHSFNISRWNKLVDDANTYGDGLFTIEALKHNAADQVDASRNNNPEFAFGGNFAVVYATRALLSRPLPNGTAPNVPDYKNIAPFYLNETFPQDWYRIPDSYSLVDFLDDVVELFLFQPQILGASYEGKFIPLDIEIPTAPAAIGCLAATLLASAAPAEVEPVVQAVNALKDQILKAVLGSAGCDVSNYNKPGGLSYTVGGENTAGGSGSGITHFGEWDAKSHKPTGQSAGQAKKRSLRFEA